MVLVVPMVFSCTKIKWLKAMDSLEAVCDVVDVDLLRYTLSRPSIAEDSPGIFGADNMGHINMKAENVSHRFCRPHVHNVI